MVEEQRRRERSTGWELVVAAQRGADAERLSAAGVVPLTLALDLVRELGPYVVGERVVRERLRRALAVRRGHVLSVV